MRLNPEEVLRREVSDLCRQFHARGWVANHDGNVSVRLEGGGFLASPTAVSKADVSPESLVLLDAEGKVVGGGRKVFSEISLHLAVYRARPDVRWVAHAHPPTATGFAVSGEALFDPPFMAEPVVSLGVSIPTVAYAAPGASTAGLEQAISQADAVLLANHGVVTVGAEAEAVLLRMELVEHLARIQLVARQLGGARPLPAEDVEKLLEARRKAGLGPSASSSPAPAAPPVGDVGALVQEALRRYR